MKKEKLLAIHIKDKGLISRNRRYRDFPIPPTLTHALTVSVPSV